MKNSCAKLRFFFKNLLESNKMTTMIFLAIILTVVTGWTVCDFRPKFAPNKLALGILFVANFWLLYASPPALCGPFFGLAGAFVKSAITASALAFILMRIRVGKSARLSSLRTNNSFFHDKTLLELSWLTKIGIFLIMIFFIWMTVAIFYSKLFYLNSYRSMIGKIEETTCKEELPSIDKNSIDNIRVVDERMAIKKAGRVLGTDGYGAAYNIHDTAIQKVKNNLTFVSVLGYRGFWQWLTNKSIPGFICTNAEDAMSASSPLTKQEIVFSPSAFFQTDLRRFLWFEGYCHYRLSDFTFEVDDEGKGWWIVTAAKPSIGWNANKVFGIIMVDPETGEHEFFKPQEAPAWIDRIYPEEIFKERINWAGSMKNGFWASCGLGSKTGLYEQTPNSEIWLTWNKGGEARWFACCSNLRSSDTSLAFIYQMDTRTGKVFSFKLDGAPINDQAARVKLESLVSDQKWEAEEPILYEVNDEPTWVASLTLNQGEYQALGFVHYEREIRSIGRTKQEAITSYLKEFGKIEGKLISENVPLKKHCGFITKITTQVQDGQTFYLIEIPQQTETVLDDMKFIAKWNVSKDLPFIKDKDQVEISYYGENEFGFLMVKSISIIK